MVVDMIVSMQQSAGLEPDGLKIGPFIGIQTITTAKVKNSRLNFNFQNHLKKVAKTLNGFGLLSL